ncbi:MAG TPA: hypothetical protein VJQ84_00250 [Solirubrobacterales bacterium]|nr:hypothetical protein [Solirubrobacterales bacterium]
MGILDEAIREHLELKRQHGAGDSELKQLEDEAFGQAERPGSEGAADSAAEAPTQFMTQPEVPAEGDARREPTIADLQEPPPPPESRQAEPAGEVAMEEPTPDETAVPAEEQAAIEHEAVADVPEPEAVEPAGPSTEERQAIAEQPTELFDVEEEIGPPTPTDEELVEEEIAEPRLAPTDPLAGLEETEGGEVSVQGPAPDDDDDYDDEDDAFWNEQRLSDELDQALEAPVEEPEPEPGPEPDPAEHEYEDEPESEELPVAEEVTPEPVSEAEPETAHREEDVLEETPDFLEDSEDDQLWFEQKPPKDFDFDD